MNGWRWLRVRVPAAAAVLAAALVSGAVPASAQRRVPAAGSAAIGGEAGWFLPSEDALSAGPTVAGTFDYYLTRRVSLRPTIGWADPDFDRESGDSLRQVRVTLDLLYNWEYGAWHPFVGAGLGAYFLQPKDNGHAFGDSETKPGLGLGGGIEYFVGRDVAIKGEARYHIISDSDLVFDPSGLALTLGLKKYF
jgi:hypothetical protein